MPYIASATQLWTASPAAHSALSSYEFYLREALCGEWITEMKRLKTQLGFHSSWEVINIWISCRWELISFSSGQVLLCVPATVFVFSWAVAVNMAGVLLNMKNCVKSEPVQWSRTHTLDFGSPAGSVEPGCCVQAAEFSSVCNLREAAAFMPVELHEPRNHKTWITGMRSSWEDRGNRLLAAQREENLFSTTVAICVHRSAEELRVMLHWWKLTWVYPLCVPMWEKCLW